MCIIHHGRSGGEIGKLAGSVTELDMIILSMPTRYCVRWAPDGPRRFLGILPGRRNTARTRFPEGGCRRAYFCDSATRCRILRTVEGALDVCAVQGPNARISHRKSRERSLSCAARRSLDEPFSRCHFLYVQSHLLQHSSFFSSSTTLSSFPRFGLFGRSGCVRPSVTRWAEYTRFRTHRLSHGVAQDRIAFITHARGTTAHHSHLQSVPPSYRRPPILSFLAGLSANHLLHSHLLSRTHDLTLFRHQ